MRSEWTAELVEGRLRRWAEESARPLVVTRRGPPSAQEVEHRLREAMALWVLCAKLQDANPRPA